MRLPLVLRALVALVVALGLCPPAPAAAARNCVGDEGASARAAGDPGGGGEDDEDAPPKFSAAFYKLTFTLDVSVDGMDGTELPISIEDVCDIAKRRAKEAAQLAGGDGVALLLPRTTVWQGRTRLTGTAAAAALDGADTATLRVRLAPRRSWHEDEDGDPVATFSTRRITITD
jgi:hypothetical protein